VRQVVASGCVLDTRDQNLKFDNIEIINDSQRGALEEDPLAVIISQFTYGHIVNLAAPHQYTPRIEILSFSNSRENPIFPRPRN
jgi:hypothetical protein